jgi:hypothetical protein
MVSSAVVLLAVEARLSCDDADTYDDTSVEVEGDDGMIVAVVVVLTIEAVVIIDEGDVVVAPSSSKGVMVTVVLSLLA